MDKFRFPTSTDFHVPHSMVGMTIRSVPVKEHFQLIRLDIEKYANNNFHLSRLLKIVDRVDETNCLGHMKSMLVLNHMTTYLRIKLLSDDARIVEKVAVLIDTLVKNCHYRVHLLIGNRIFMKTFGIVTRQLLIDQRAAYYRVGQRMLDILQGWGEYFSQEGRCIIYPHIVDTYQKMQFKYGISYQKAHNSLPRLPIFSGPLHVYEVLVAQGRRLGIKDEILITDCHSMESKASLTGEMLNKKISVCTKFLAPISPRFKTYMRSPLVDVIRETASSSNGLDRQPQLPEDVKSNLINRLQKDKEIEELFESAMRVKLDLTQKIIQCEEIDENMIKISAYDITKASITGQVVRRQELLSASECSTSASSIEEMIYGKPDGISILEHDAPSATSIVSAGDSYKDCVVTKANDDEMEDSNFLQCAANNIETLYSCSPLISPLPQRHSTCKQANKISYHSAMSPNYDRKYVPSCSSHPSSDPDLEVKYFGHQRVLVRKANK